MVNATLDPEESEALRRRIGELEQADALLAARVRQTAAVAELGLVGIRGESLGTLMDKATAMVARVLEVEYSKILELLPEGRALLVRAGTGWKPGVVGHVTVDAGRDTQAGYTLHQSMHVPVIVEDLRRETRFIGAPILHDHGVVSSVTVVIEGGDRPFGILSAHTARYRKFNQDDINFLQTAANVVSTAIDRERREEVISELSTPILQITPRVLLTPIVGRLDARRAAQLEKHLLRAIRSQRARVVVVDVTGAGYVEKETASRLSGMVHGARLLGAEVIVTGISSKLAAALLGAWVGTPEFRTAGDLQEGIEVAFHELGVSAPPLVRFLNTL